MDWHQLWEIASAPDNVPIVALLFLIPFFTWYGLKQALENDRLIERLEANPDLAKIHHRKTDPWRKEWEEKLHVWPYLLRIEFLAALLVTVILMIWSITLNAPLEEPANPTLTMNPAIALWYVLGLQEMMVYFDPWIAGVVMPTIILIGLMLIPYIDPNPLGNGYYTFKQRKFAILTFSFGFLILWIVLIIIGTFIRGPGWMWFWPGMTWDHHRVIFEANRDLHQMVGLGSQPAIGIFGGLVVGLYFIVAGFFTHLLLTRTEVKKSYDQMNIFQILTVELLIILMMSLPLKIAARLLFRIKYVWVTPWFNI
ncbi:MAG: cytochrome C [Acidobacteria bacterium]|nr:cytochrome C [Acidobacteriota bacterium]